MRLFLDECLSPQLAIDLSKEGEHLVVHPRNNGGLGDADHQVLERCTKDNLVIVTENARDFRALAARADIHPGIILLPCVARQISERLLRVAIAHLEAIGNPGDVLVNHVLEVNIDEMVEIFALPEA
jgi:predicted nuclease of predicted toxin-antitoxin system